LVFFYASTILSTSLEIKRDFSKKNNKNSQNIFILTSNYTERFYNFNRGGSSKFSYSDGALTAIHTPVIAPKQKTLSQKEIDRKIKKYTVISGDTISSIAELFGVSESTITIENNIKKGKLKIGQDLIILPVSGVKYKIQKGDNILLISYRHSVKKEVILEFNEIENESFIKIGKEIIIPGGKKYIPKKYGSDSFGKIKMAGNGNVSGYVNRNGIISYGQGAKISVPKKKNGRYRYTKTNYGYFTHPAPGSVRTQNTHHRNAVDMGAPTGTKIYAAASGTVIKSYYGG
jgi:murein DD-endopeptidase MepM/ murein hydrolase activator NlpD